MIKKNKIKFSKGFTMIEIVVVLAIFSALLFVTVDLFQSMFTNSSQQLNSLNNIDLARMVTQNFANEMRSAKMGRDGSTQVYEPNPSEIIFFSPLGADPGSVNKIRYFISNSDCSVSPNSDCPALNCDTLCKGVTPVSYIGAIINGILIMRDVYAVNTEVVKPILTGIANGSSTPVDSAFATPAFYYYSDAYDGSGTSLSQPITDTSLIKFVGINLLVLNKITPQDTSAFDITGGAAIRSLKTNLGN